MGFLDDDIYIAVTSELRGVKGWMQWGKGFPIARFGV